MDTVQDYASYSNITSSQSKQIFMDLLYGVRIYYLVSDVRRYEATRQD
jgi:hypothetical protein